MLIDTNTIIDWCAAGIIGFFGLAILSLSDKSKSTKLFVTVLLLTAIWSVCTSITIPFPSNIQNPAETSLFFVKISYILGILIAASFFLFAHSYQSNKKTGKKTTLSVILPAIILIILISLTDLIIAKSVVSVVQKVYIWSYGSLWFLFDIYFDICWFGGIGLMCYKLFKEKNPVTRKHLKFVVIALGIGIIPPILVSIILPRLGTYNYNWIAPVSAIIWMSIIAYSITKHHLFQIKIITTELITFSLWIFILVRLFIATNTREVVIESTLLVISVIFGIMLIRAVLKEIKQREQIELLAGELRDVNQHLEQKVAAQTLEIRHAYELEKKARRDLEKLNETKDQFIMITQHHLRTPVTSIRWGLESALAGTYGKLTAKMRTGLETISTATSRLQRIIDDFLSITALKVGSQILSITRTSLRSSLEDVFEELRLDVEEKHLTVTYPQTPDAWPEMDVDAHKIREVILIVIENAIRYNIPHGKIVVTNTVNNETFEMKVTNTGIGIKDTDKEKLFTSLFYRGESARVAHPIGMGIGLSVSRAIVRAHHGELTIHSNGPDTGAEVMIRIPIRFVS